MKIIEHLIQEIHPGKQEALEAIDKKYHAIEDTLGFPPTRRLWAVSGAHVHNISIQVREWESMAAMEAAFERAFENADLQALHPENNTIIKSSRTEYYWSAD
jgi:hypothetical protein